MDSFENITFENTPASSIEDESILDIPIEEEQATGIVYYCVVA
jgi:hypothetical protein